MSPNEELDTRIVGEETAAYVEGNEIDQCEERAVDEVTHEAESHVEQTRNYQEAEAIETAFTELVDNSQAVGESEIEATPIPLPIGPKIVEATPQPIPSPRDDISATPIPVPVGLEIIEATPQPIPSPRDEISATPITLPGQEKHDEVSNETAVQSATVSESNVPVYGEPSVPLRELEGQLPEQEDLNQSHKAGQEFPGMDFSGHMPGGGDLPGGFPGDDSPGMGGLPSDKGGFFGEDPLGNLFDPQDAPPIPGMQEDPADQNIGGSSFGQGNMPFDGMDSDNDPFGTKGNSDGSPSLGGRGKGPGVGILASGGKKGGTTSGNTNSKKGGKSGQSGQGGNKDSSGGKKGGGKGKLRDDKLKKYLADEKESKAAQDKGDTDYRVVSPILNSGGGSPGSSGSVTQENGGEISPWSTMDPFEDDNDLDYDPKAVKCTPEDGGGSDKIPREPIQSKFPGGWDIDPVPPHLMREENELAAYNPNGATALTPDGEGGGGKRAAIRQPLHKKSLGSEAITDPPSPSEDGQKQSKKDVDKEGAN